MMPSWSASRIASFTWIAANISSILESELGGGGDGEADGGGEGRGEGESGAVGGGDGEADGGGEGERGSALLFSAHNFHPFPNVFLSLRHWISVNLSTATSVGPALSQNLGKSPTLM